MYVYIYIYMYIYLYIYIHIYIYIYINFKILSSFLIRVLVSGWNWWMNFQPETKALIRKLERTLNELYRKNVSLLFNKTCLNGRRLHNYIYIYIYIYVPHSIRHQTFFVQAFKIVVDSWIFSMLFLYIVWDDWLIFMISGSNQQLHQELEYTLLKSDCHSW